MLCRSVHCYVSAIFYTHRILPVDLSDPVATRAATEKARELFGQIDILVNNAGTVHGTFTHRVLVSQTDWCIYFASVH